MTLTTIEVTIMLQATGFLLQSSDPKQDLKLFRYEIIVPREQYSTPNGSNYKLTTLPLDQ